MKHLFRLVLLTFLESVRTDELEGPISKTELFENGLLSPDTFEKTVIFQVLLTNFEDIDFLEASNSLK